MTELPDEWKRVAVHVRWPDPDLRRRYWQDRIILLAPDGTAVLESDIVADDLVDDLEKPAR